MSSPQNVEAWLQVASLVRLGLALLGPALHGQRGPRTELHVWGLAWLAVLASWFDRCDVSWFQDHPHYVFRACGQAGLAQGLLALPSLATAIYVATRSWWWQQAATLFLASSFQILLWLSWTARSTEWSYSSGSTSRPPAAPSGEPGGNIPNRKEHDASQAHILSRSQYEQIPISPTATGIPAVLMPCRPGSGRLLFLSATVAGCLLSTANALLHGAARPSPSSPQLLPGSVFKLPRDIVASAWVLQVGLLPTVLALDHLSSALPRSFTPGEVGILVQALLALAAGSGAYLASASRQGLLHVLWSPHVVQLVESDLGMHVPAFCILVLFWVLMLAACSAVALWRVSPGGAMGPQPAALPVAEHVAAAADVDPAPSSAPATGLRPRKASASSMRVSREALLSGVGNADDSSEGGDWLNGPALPAVTRIAAAGGAVLSLAMLVDLALWVLGRFVAASSRPRLATLAYWFGCLSVAVPFMYVVSRASSAREAEREQRTQQEQQNQQRPKQQRKQQQDGRSPMAQQSGASAEGLRGGLQDRHWSLDAGQRIGASEGGVVENGFMATRDSDPSAGTIQFTPCHGQTEEGRAQFQAESGVCIGGLAHAANDDLGRGHLWALERPQGNQLHKKQEQQAPNRRRRSALLTAVYRLLGVPHIVMRKGYHLLAIVLFLPAFGWDVRMLQASLAVAVAVLVLLEVLRCLGPARLRAAIGSFMADFADARDSGPVYVTHFTLLLGIAVPVLLGDSVCGAATAAMMNGLYGSEAARPMVMTTASGPLLSAAAARLMPSCRTVLGLSGLVSLGSGDTAAACVGFLLGRRPLFRGSGSKKTWEGTLSGAAAMLGSWAVVVWWMDVRWALSWGTWAALAWVTGAVALLEAVTQQLDNVVVPLYYLTHLVLVMTGN